MAKAKKEAGQESLQATLPADTETLNKLYTLYNENTEKLRLAFERLERRFREIDPYNIYNSIAEGLITLDLREDILTLNRAAEKIFAVSEKEVLGKPFRQIAKGCESVFVDYLAVKNPEKHYDISFRNSQGDIVCLRGRFSSLLDRNGCEIGTTCLITDVSIEKLLEEKARRSDRLTALGELAAGVAHEMRNPLTTIRGYLQILPYNKDDDEFIHEFSDNLIREIDRLTRLTDNLLNMAKPISPELLTEPLSGVVHSVSHFLADKFSQANVDIHIEEDTTGTSVLMDSDRIKQVFINLLVNAVEAMKEGGLISIRFSQRRECYSEKEGLKTYVVVELKDTGPGMPPHVLERVFDPFFTTKDSGTGLGLSLSHRIIEEHGGFLRVDSIAGEGTCFWIFLPLSDK